MVLRDHVEEGTVSDEARPIWHADHMPRAIKVRSQHARNQEHVQVHDSRRGSEACQSDANCDDLNESAGPRKPTGRLFQEFGSRFSISEKLRNESDVPACRAGLFCTPCVIPVPVFFAAGSKSLVNAEPHWAVDWAEASERTVGVRDGW